MIMFLLSNIIEFDNKESKIKWFLDHEWLSLSSVILLVLLTLITVVFHGSINVLFIIIIIMGFSIIFDIFFITGIHRIYENESKEKNDEYQKLYREYRHYKDMYNILLDRINLYSKRSEPPPPPHNDDPFGNPHSNSYSKYYNAYDLYRFSGSYKNPFASKYPREIINALNIFGLSADQNYTADEIKKTYRMLILKYHPDKPGGDTEMTIKINEAYSVLEKYNW